MAEGPQKPAANVRMFACLQPVGTGLCRLTQQLHAAHRYARARFCRTAKNSIGIILLTLQTVIGLFEAYIVFVSDLPASSWNWLLIPFNPLPLVFWRWRRYWAWGFVTILLVWEAFMLLSPHLLTDPAYLVIVFAYVIFYVKVARTPVTKFT